MYDQIRKSMQLQESLSADEGPGGAETPEERDVLKLLLPRDDAELEERFVQLAELCLFCNRLREAIEDRLKAEALRLDTALLKLENTPAQSDEGREPLLKLTEGTAAYRQGADELFDLLEEDDFEIYESAMSLIKQGQKHLTFASEQASELEGE